jgi:threonine dehydratase
MRVTGWRCAVCSAQVPISMTFPWRCPNSTLADRHHVLQMVMNDDAEMPVSGSGDDAHPYLRHDGNLAWSAHADANGLDLADRRRLVLELDAAVQAVAGVGFVATPFGRSDALSAALGFTDGGGVWVKDETGGVGGSQKARHLFTILLHLRAAELLGQLTQRPPLAIASCGNAALAASILAAAADWPIDVYVPTWMSDGFGDELVRLGARIHRCERRPGDHGDPAMLRFREAVAGGAIPFTVQGPENALALDGGRTLGWEIGEQVLEQRVGELDRIYVQVGGGAFASCVGATAPARRLHAVQAEGCAPLARAWTLAADEYGDGLVRFAPAQWDRFMWPWDDPHSLADGILDDETYDWIGVFDAIGPVGDTPVVAAEADIVAAHALARSAGFDVSATGSAGLAGLLAMLDAIQPTERVAVVMSGVAR